MRDHTETLRGLLARGPLPPRQLIEKMGISQPTLSRTVSQLGDELIRIGAARSIRYALRDSFRGLPDIPVHRIDAEGRIHPLGLLIPVRPSGFVMRQQDGANLHSDGLPWWLFDMRPQGYLGRAYAARHGPALGLPPRLVDWDDTHVLRALLAHGHDLIGNLLLGDHARGQYLAAPAPVPISDADKAASYAQLAREAANGELPGSSAGGEQPKFTAHVITPDGPRHVIVKFSEPEDSPVSERWRDLLLAEHLALQTLHEAGVAAARSRIIDRRGQRFLEVERFDRVGTLGRRGVISLSALDAEFIGAGTSNWPTLVRSLLVARIITPDAVETTDLLWAFGNLTGNTDMHAGNLSFLADQEPPYMLAPAYDMTPMGFAPRSGGGLPDKLADALIDARIGNTIWRQAITLARTYVERLQTEPRFSPRFAACITALDRHVAIAAEKIGRLG